MDRKLWIDRITQGYRVSPIVAILGPRQCGKTTLARQFTKIHGEVYHFDCENPVDRKRLAEPMLALADLKGLIVIDEVQLIPELFSVLRVLIDRENHQQRYLILGSASRDLIRQSSETLAGRIYYLELTPFSLNETDNPFQLWSRGGFPLSYLAESDVLSYEWREQYISTFLERDIPMLGINIPADTLRRFWMMLAHYHGNIFNASELGKSLGSNHVTMRKYLDILSGTFMVRVLSPWFENISKRQVKSPKIYFKDSGILHALLGLSSAELIQSHPKLGASWEGFALEQVIRCYQAKPEQCYFWATHSDAELDLLIIKDGKRLGFEFKYGDAPSRTRSMSITLEVLQLDSLSVVYPGEQSYQLAQEIHVVPLRELINRW